VRHFSPGVRICAQCVNPEPFQGRFTKNTNFFRLSNVYIIWCELMKIRLLDVIKCVGVCVSCITILSLIGCSAAYFKKAADEDVYRIIHNKSQWIDGMPTRFTIDDDPVSPMVDDTATTTNVISLMDAITIAVENSRSYQSRQESLYLEGLSLTSARHSYDPHYSGSGSATVERDAKTNSLFGAISFGIDKMLATGGDLSIGITTNLFRYISVDDPQKSAASALSATFVQPLLRGAGRRVALENLTQAERSMVYSIRDFVRYRKSFSVNIAQRYYSVLQQKDEVKNSLQNYENLTKDRKRAELMAQAGRLPEFEVDQARQNELRARDRWIIATQQYETALDEFKILLGLPMEVPIEPDTAELDSLTSRGIASIELPLEQAIVAALDKRLDLKNTRDNVDDAKRQVYVAKNALLPDVSAILTYNNATIEELKPLKFNDETDNYSFGISADFPFDRLSERNAYRQSLINLDSTRRNLAEATDRIALEVRDAYRRLEQTRKSYEIQKMSVQLAQRRVRSTTLLHQAGRASTRDLLDSQEALLNTQNSLTQALIDHTNAQLDLLLAMETLTVDDKGLWQEGEFSE